MPPKHFQSGPISSPQPIAPSPEQSPTTLTTSNGKQKASDQTEEFAYISDERSPAEREKQHKETQAMYYRNLQLLGIEMTAKKKVQYVPSKLFRVDLGNQWYTNITDNQVQSQNVFFTVHGSPGDHREWAGLETEMNKKNSGKVRWINFIIPGFDGEDERRGNYSGSVEDLSKMISLVLSQRKVAKIIYIGHSMGSIFGSYFMNRYSELIRGYVNVTGIVNQWYTGLMTFYRNVIVAHGFGKGPNHTAMMRLLNKNQFRQQHRERFVNQIKQVSFDPKVPFPHLSVTEMCAYIKLFSSLPKGCSQFYQLNQELTLLRVLIFGKNDPLHEPYKTQEQIYSITKGRLKFSGYPKNKKIIKAMKKQLEETIKQIYGIRIQAQKVQQYFCYHFDDTGHNAHKRRPKQISKILRIYLTVLRVMEKYSTIVQSRL